MSDDYLLTIAAQLDGEPECRCCQTDRGTDTLGCPMHDTACRCGHPIWQHTSIGCIGTVGCTCDDRWGAP